MHTVVKLGGLALSILIWGGGVPVLAQSVSSGGGYLRTVNDEDAVRGAVTIDVASGYGVNLSFQRLDDPIIKVWVDDMTELAVDFDRPIPEAKVIHLRRLSPASLPLQTRSQSRNTLLTVVTRQKVYQFFVRLSDSRTQFKTIEVVPGRNNPALIPVGGQDFASLVEIERGIEKAIQESRIAPNSPLIPRVRNFVVLVRQGKTFEQASAESGISLAVVSEFGRLGKKVPTILERLRGE
jgi:hypothetical protein